MYALNILSISLILLLHFKVIHTSKIIYIFPLRSYSHKVAFDPLIFELAKRGHNVTVASPYKYPPTNNLNDIVLDGVQLMSNSNFQAKMFKFVGIHPILTTLMFKDLYVLVCKSYLESPKIKQLLNEGKQFDLVIVNAFINECVLVTAGKIGKNLITHSPAGWPGWAGMSIPMPMSYVPNPVLPYTSKMTFFQRLNNAFTTAIFEVLFDYLFIPAMQSEISKHFPENPSITEAMANVSFIVTNADPVLIIPKPGIPNIVNVGGMHCKKAEKLPKDLEDFITSSGENGFIYFSLGSNAQSRFLPDTVKSSLLDAFSKLKQKIIWKYEEKMESVAGNIKIVQWAPQQDILGHPKIKAFITHGGLLSMQESVHHAVPVVAVPLFGDQGSNVARIEELEIGIKIDFNNISGSSILYAVNEILLNEKYKTNMLKYSAIFRNRNPHPIEEAVSWVEYVIKHDGAWHLRNAGQDLNVIQYYLLDVIALLVIIFVFIVFISIYAVKFVFKKFFCGKNTNVTKSKKKQ